MKMGQVALLVGSQFIVIVILSLSTAIAGSREVDMAPAFEATYMRYKNAGKVRHSVLAQVRKVDIELWDIEKNLKKTRRNSAKYQILQERQNALKENREKLKERLEFVDAQESSDYDAISGWLDFGKVTRQPTLDLNMVREFSKSPTDWRRSRAAKRQADLTEAQQNLAQAQSELEQIKSEFDQTMKELAEEKAEKETKLKNNSYSWKWKTEKEYQGYHATLVSNFSAEEARQQLKYEEKIRPIQAQIIALRHNIEVLQDKEGELYYQRRLQVAAAAVKKLDAMYDDRQKLAQKKIKLEKDLELAQLDLKKSKQNQFRILFPGREPRLEKKITALEIALSDTITQIEKTDVNNYLAVTQVFSGYYDFQRTLARGVRQGGAENINAAFASAASDYKIRSVPSGPQTYSFSAPYAKENSEKASFLSTQ